MNHSTALLIFSRTAAAEASKKKLFCRAKHNRKAAEGFIQHAVQAAAKSGLPWHLCDEGSQTGNSFGQKLATAIQQTFQKGHGKLLVIGNDCPGLTPSVLKKAAADLNHHDWVLGPDARGGVYLIGITAASFNSYDFENLHWQTSNVFAELKELAVIHASIFCLPVLNDVNNADDVVALTKGQPSVPRWLYKLLTYLTEVQPRIFYKNLLHSAIVIRSSQRRGPPHMLYC